MKNLLIISFAMLASAGFAQEVSCSQIIEENFPFKEGMKIDVADDCFTVIISVWDEFTVMDLEHDSGVKEVIRSIAGGLIEQGVISKLKAVGLKEIHVKILGEARSTGYYDLHSERIILNGSLSEGSSLVEGGLGGRQVLYAPVISDNSQKTGRVVVKVCVDQTGEVVSAQYTQRGSTTTDADLKSLAIKSAERFKFSESDIEKQCGIITIDFNVN